MGRDDGLAAFAVQTQKSLVQFAGSILPSLQTLSAMFLQSR